MKTTLKLFIAIALLSIAAFGQTALSTTTLGAALTNTATTVTLASTSTMLSSGPSNQINTVLWVDREFLWVDTVVDSTHVTVRRGKGIGAGGYPQAHANSAKVYFAITATYGGTIIPAARYFRNEQPTVEPALNSTCTSTSEFVLPKVYVMSGNRYNCLSGGTWILEGTGSMDSGGIGTFTAYCTGTVGSATTNWLNDTSCSGATSSLPRNIVSRAGTLANLYATSTANFVGTGGSVITLVKNGTATAVACTPAAGAKTCSDLTHSVSVAVGDTLAWSMLTATSDTAAEVVANISEY